MRNITYIIHNVNETFSGVRQGVEELGKCIIIKARRGMAIKQ